MAVLQQCASGADSRQPLQVADRDFSNVFQFHEQFWLHVLSTAQDHWEGGQPSLFCRIPTRLPTPTSPTTADDDATVTMYEDPTSPQPASEQPVAEFACVLEVESTKKPVKVHFVWLVPSSKF
jgi:hypothetical protein